MVTVNESKLKYKFYLGNVKVVRNVNDRSLLLLQNNADTKGMKEQVQKQKRT